MITFVEGELVERQPTRAIVACGGVGYEIAIPLSTFDRLPPQGTSCRILTRLVVREDAHLLFGFATNAERTLFDLLMSVSRVGPKVALAVLSGMSVSEIRQAIAFEDVAMLARVSGVGKKTAERIVVELKDKIEKAAGAAEPGASREPESLEGVTSEAVAALVVLGYSRPEALDAVKKAGREMGKGASTEDVLRRALSMTPV